MILPTRQMHRLTKILASSDTTLRKQFLYLIFHRRVHFAADCSTLFHCFIVESQCNFEKTFFEKNAALHECLVHAIAHAHGIP